MNAPIDRNTGAVLLLAYGGPASLDEIEPYISDVRGGRPLAPRLLEEIKDRYRRIGGRSPLLEITQRQAIALEEELRKTGLNLNVFVGMRHWFPYIRDAVQAMAGAGIRRVVGICMAPQYSQISIGAYRRQYDLAVGQLDQPFETIFVESWHQEPYLLRAFATKVSEALARFSETDRADVEILFTAHSLPQSRLQPDDPYDRQQRETATAVAELVNHSRWSFAYQSQGYTNDEWLGPRVEDRLRAIAASGKRPVLLVPTGFICDHVEILYDVDIIFRDLAASLGLPFERSESLNDDPMLVRALLNLVGRTWPSPIEPGA